VTSGNEKQPFLRRAFKTRKSRFATRVCKNSVPWVNTEGVTNPAARRPIVLRQGPLELTTTPKDAGGTIEQPDGFQRDP